MKPVSAAATEAQPCRIAFDARALQSPASGVHRYAHQLFAALGGLPGVRLVAVGAEPAQPLPPGIARLPVRARLPTNLGWTVASLPLALRRTRVDLFHAPAYTAPPWGVHPLVVTIHDVSYARRPEWYPYRRDPVRRAFYRRSALAADQILTDSEFSRSEIHAAYGIDPELIRVVPLGVGPPFRDGADPGSATLPPGVRTPFVLHVGDLHLRRNLETAIRAVGAVRTVDGPCLQLVLAGTDRGIAQRLRRLGHQTGCGDRLRIVGRPDDDVLLSLYRRAAAFIYPSRYEGFGLPLLEAMACGAPVIASRAASIPEVVGGAGRLLDPDDVDGFSTAVTDVLEQPHVANAMREQSRRRAARFTWRRTAEATLEAYRGCLSRVGG